MDINEIKESGLLELYVLSDLNDAQAKIVEKALSDFPSLKQDIHEIESALQVYANAHAVKAPAVVLDSVMNKIKESKNLPNQPKQISSAKEIPSTAGSSLWSKLIPIGSLLGMVGLALMLYLNNQKFEEEKLDLAAEIENCQEQNADQLERLAMLESINSGSNEVIFADATEKYPDTKLFFNHNPALKKNYIQIENLPPLADNQSYQLWSLKGDNPPSPLNVFEGDVSKLFEVMHVDGSDAYAITIEPKGGQDSPTMENLIAVIKIA